MTRPLVYLAGGIAGLSGAEATDWRANTYYALLRYEIDVLDPMRAKKVLSKQPFISTDFHDYAHNGAFFTSRGIMLEGEFADPHATRIGAVGEYTERLWHYLVGEENAGKVIVWRKYPQIESKPDGYVVYSRLCLIPEGTEVIHSETVSARRD